MGYKIVAVNPLKQFPIAQFGLANVVSLDDAKKQIFEKYRKMAQMRIDAGDAYVEINGGQKLNGDGRAEIFSDYEKVAKKEFEKFEEGRWPKIGPALKLHLSRQERRKAHFDSACRLNGCDNPRRGKRSGATHGTKSRRPGACPLFCGAHVGLRKCLKQEVINALYKSSANRVHLV